ncbi:MAG: CPBP family intramembrane glutamic endopeptidase [Acidobacteriota bacterium]
MSDRFRRSDLGLVLLGLAGLAAFLLLYQSAFPQANVSLEVTRAEAVATARSFLQQQGASLAGFKDAVIFSGDDGALSFLQHTLGVEEASRWARDEVPIWTWNLRWFKPQQKEEWLAWLGLDGSIVGFRHRIEEAAEGADLEQGAAQQVAEGFLRQQGLDLGAWRRVEASTEKKDNRTDYRFAWEKQGTSITWKEDDPEAGTGAVRVGLVVQGDEVGGYNLFLKVPEEFARQQQQIQSVGQLLAIAAFALTTILAFIAIGLAIARVRQGEVEWRPAILLGGFVGLLYLVFNLSSWPQAKALYPTQLSWAAYIGILLISMVLLTVVYGAIVLFTAAAGVSLGRETFADSLVGFAEAAQGRLRHPSLAIASLRGYALGFAFIGYLTVFYIFAQRYLGAWLPAEGPYSEIFNQYLPFLAPLTTSLVAAISEEVTYRLFGISLIKRYMKSTVLALLIPAAIWAFAHSTYPVFPVYIRGIELTIGGIIFGIAFLRLGLLTCIVAHYVVDAFLLSTPLLTSGNSTYLVFGVVAIALALLPAVLGLLARRSAGSAALL